MKEEADAGGTILLRSKLIILHAPCGLKIQPHAILRVGQLWVRMVVSLAFARSFVSCGPVTEEN